MKNGPKAPRTRKLFIMIPTALSARGSLIGGIARDHGTPHNPASTKLKHRTYRYVSLCLKPVFYVLSCIKLPRSLVMQARVTCWKARRDYRGTIGFPTYLRSYLKIHRLGFDEIWYASVRDMGPRGRESSKQPCVKKDIRQKKLGSGAGFGRLMVLRFSAVPVIVPEPVASRSWSSSVLVLGTTRFFKGRKL